MKPQTAAVVVVAVGVALLFAWDSFAATTETAGAGAPAGGKAAAAKAKGEACQLAEKNYANYVRAGGPAVPGWDKLTCDEKIALASPGGPIFGPYVALAGILWDRVGAKTVAAVSGGGQHITDQLTSTQTSAGSDGVTVAGHKIF